MNFNSIYNQILGNRYVGLSIWLLEGGFKAYGVEVIKRKDEYKIDKTFEFSEKIEELKELVIGEYPLILNIDGAGIIHKNAQKQNIDQEQIEQSLFPGLNLSDFFVQKHINTNNTGYVSIANRSKILSIIEELKTIGFFTVDLSLGLFSIENYLSYITYENEEIRISNWDVSLEDNLISKLSKTDNPQKYYINFQDEQVDSYMLVPYCSTISYHLNNHTVISDFPELQKFKKESKFRRYYISVVFIAPIILLVGLLINFSFYSHFNSQLESSKINYALNRSTLSELEKLEKSLDSKQKFIKESLIGSSSADIKYCDRIALSLSKDIVLTRMEVNPLLFKIKKDKEVKFNTNLIKIEGEASKESSIRNWIDALNSESWIREVKITNFVNEDKKPITFALKIFIE